MSEAICFFLVPINPWPGADLQSRSLYFSATQTQQRPKRLSSNRTSGGSNPALQVPMSKKLTFSNMNNDFQKYPFQGQVPSAVPFLGFAIKKMKKGDMKRAMFLAKGSLFLGRMSQLSDGMSFLLEAQAEREKYN